VTLNDCLFTNSVSPFQGSVIYQYDQASGATIENCTFSDDLSAAASSYTLCDIYSRSAITVENSALLNAPAWGMFVQAGVITGNYITNGGTGSYQHEDGIFVATTTGPLSITNNFIDWTNPLINPTAEMDNALRIVPDLGNISNVTASGNYLLGGAFTVSAGADGGSGEGACSNVSVTNNYIGFGLYGAFYPDLPAGVSFSGNDVFDFSNPAYAAAAWAAYQAGGLNTPNLVVSTNGAAVSAAASGASTIYGSPSAHLYGGDSENILIAGYGREYIFGGTGANLFTYLVPNGDQGNPSMVNDFDPAKDVFDLSHIDANLTQAGLQNFTFIGTNAFTSAGAQVRYQQDPTTNTTWVEATLAGDTTPDLVIQVVGLYAFTAANFALTPQQSATDIAYGAALTDPWARSNSLFEYSYSNVKGRAYSSYVAFQYNGGLAADDLNLSASANELDLYQSNETITRGGGVKSAAESFAIATLRPTIPGGSFNVAYHSNETINVNGVGAETFALSSGFGNETINGFAPSGTNADTLQLSKSAFSYLNSGMSQAQDLSAVLRTVGSGPNATIVDSFGDRLTLTGVTGATLAANPSAVTFV
jgi:hypothetical protein